MDRYIIVFAVFGFLGWIWESIFCTIKKHQWANRGFLFGPICPIYGFGAIIGLAIQDLNGRGVIPELVWWQMFLLAFVVSMVLEYPTSWLLEKLFHARWWDYSKTPLNINGRTSVPTSAAFGLAGILIMKLAIPFTEVMFQYISGTILHVCALVFVAVISVDTTLTVSALTDFQKRVSAIDAGFQNRMTDLVNHMYDVKDTVKHKAVERIVVFQLPKRKAEIAKSLRNRKFKELMEEYNNSGVIQQMDNYVQHGNTTTLEHCQNVAWISYLINEKLKLNADEKILVESAMMHDLFLYDWHDGKPERKTHGFDHPDIACENAMRYFDIPKKEQDIIRSHMWPLNIKRIPKSKEAAILCIADKYCSFVETFRKNKRFGGK